MEFFNTLMFPKLDMRDRTELLSVLGGAVIAAGHARDDYVAALLEREHEYPTGLPISGGVAIPHTAAEYVSVNTIAIANLSRPVVFREMGGAEDSAVDVTTVFLLVLADGAQHVSVLSKLVRRLQNAEFVDSIRCAESASHMAEIMARDFTTK